VTGGELLVQARGPDGESYRALGLPYRLGDAPRPEPAAAPGIGADGTLVLSEAGYAATDIAALRQAGVVL
jgi:crotonobetainyl-CoA:carnitine CoA-transferase CaiB-like acyl-CoA transferase